MLIIYPCVCLLQLIIFLLFIDNAWQKERLLFVLKNWLLISLCMLLLIFKIECSNLGGAFYFDELLSFYIKNDTLFVLSSITKKGQIECASRPLMNFGD
jgi:hypothetical protein